MKGRTELLELLLDEVRSFRKLIEQHVLEGVDDYGKGCIEEVVDTCDNAESVTTDDILWYYVFPEGSDVYGQVISCGYDVICNDGLARHKLKDCTVRFGDGDKKVFSYEVIRKEIDSYRELVGKDVKFDGLHCYIGDIINIPDGCIGRIVDYRPEKGEMKVSYFLGQNRWGPVECVAVYFPWDVKRMFKEQMVNLNKTEFFNNSGLLIKTPFREIDLNSTVICCEDIKDVENVLGGYNPSGQMAKDFKDALVKYGRIYMDCSRKPGYWISLVNTKNVINVIHAKKIDWGPVVFDQDAPPRKNDRKVLFHKINLNDTIIICESDADIKNVFSMYNPSNQDVDVFCEHRVDTVYLKFKEVENRWTCGVFHDLFKDLMGNKYVYARDIEWVPTPDDNLGYLRDAFDINVVGENGKIVDQKIVSECPWLIEKDAPCILEDEVVFFNSKDEIHEFIDDRFYGFAPKEKMKKIVDEWRGLPEFSCKEIENYGFGDFKNDSKYKRLNYHDLKKRISDQEEKFATENNKESDGKTKTITDTMLDIKKQSVTSTFNIPGQNQSVTSTFDVPIRIHCSKESVKYLSQYFVVSEADVHYEKIRLYRDILEFAKAANFENKNNPVYGIVKNSTDLFATKNLLNEAVFNVLFCNIEDSVKCIELFGDRIKKHYYGI